MGTNNNALSLNQARDIDQQDRDQLLSSIHLLEEALASGAPTREQHWLDHVLSALRLLEAAMQQQFANAHSPRGLLQELLASQPRLATRIALLHAQYQDLLQQIATLRRQFESGDDHALPDYVEIRQRVAWLVTALRHHQTRENDLIFEATNTDIGELD